MKRTWLTILFFITCTGFCAGAFFEVFMRGEGKNQLMDILEIFFTEAHGSVSVFTVFFQNLFMGLLFFITAFFLPRMILLLPVCITFLCSKSFILGFSTAMVLESLGLRGLIYTSMTLLTWGIPELCLFSFLTAYSLFQKETHLCNRKTPQLLAGSYVYTYSLGVTVLIIISIFKVFLLKAMT